MEFENRSYSLEEADNLIKQKVKCRDPNDNADPDYDIFHIILFLLYADYEYAIYGKTRLMKEIFLAYKEVFKPEKKVPQIAFIKHRYGPFNEEVDNILEDMVFANYIEVNGKGMSVSVKITPKGKKYIAEKFNNLGSRIQEGLRRGRKSWDTNSDLLNYVYTHYSEYLENAVKQKRYREIDWQSAFED